MLNISKHRVNSRIQETDFASLSSFTLKKRRKKRYLFGGILLIILIILFLPWTQNIISRGYVTSLYPEQRPQAIVSLISGRIDQWHVREGQYVQKGDTILNISEIKDEYFDPQLLNRTEDQIMAKESAVQSYMEKVRALDAQIDALNQNLKLTLEQAKNKIQQAQLKVTADSIDLTAARTNFDIATAQLERMETLYEQGLKSKTELEARRSKLQENQAKLISMESKLLSSKNDVINAEVEMNSIRAEFRDKLAKAESEKFSTMSDMYDAEATVSKMQNQLSNYSIRRGFYYITAPQDGYITQAVKTGIGETIKEGEEIVTIMPASYQLAVEMYVKPLDLPLVEKDQRIRIQFDGWPAIVFSGWPGVSTGTFGGQVVAIDNFADKNGRYRILVAPDPNAEPWPNGLRVGAGAKTFALLKDVPIWYELWRQINGFPPDYYKKDDANQEELNSKEKK